MREEARNISIARSVLYPDMSPVLASRREEKLPHRSSCQTVAKTQLWL